VPVLAEGDAVTKPGTLLFAVVATSGSYSDRSIHTVATYLDRATAHNHALLARERAVELSVLYDLCLDGIEREWPQPDPVNEFDPASPWERSEAPKYTVEVVYLHHEPTQHLVERNVLTDLARERGLLP
jgi:hypothetical protein